MTRSLGVTLTVVFFLTQGATSRAQIPVFCTYFTAGTVTYFPSRGDSKPLETHTWLTGNDKLRLSDNIAQVTLFCRDTSFIQLEGKGIYNVAAIAKLNRRPIHDPMMIEYFSLFWSSIATSATSTHPNLHSNQPVADSADSRRFVHTPRPAYNTSMDSVVFSWQNVSWAHKYFLRIRNADGMLCYDKVIADTQTLVVFSGGMPPGNTYYWALDIVGEGGRLQFADTGHLVLIDEMKVLPRLPALAFDSLGGIAVVLEQIEQYENAGCIRQADILFRRLNANFPLDIALDKLYAAFRQRNYF